MPNDHLERDKNANNTEKRRTRLSVQVFSYLLINNAQFQDHSSHTQLTCRCSDWRASWLTLLVPAISSCLEHLSEWLPGCSSCRHHASPKAWLCTPYWPARCEHRCCREEGLCCEGTPNFPTRQKHLNKKKILVQFRPIHSWSKWVNMSSLKVHFDWIFLQ